MTIGSGNGIGGGLAWGSVICTGKGRSSGGVAGGAGGMLVISTGSGDGGGVVVGTLTQATSK